MLCEISTIFTKCISPRYSRVSFSMSKLIDPVVWFSMWLIKDDKCTGASESLGSTFVFMAVFSFSKTDCVDAISACPGICPVDPSWDSVLGMLSVVSFALLFEYFSTDTFAFWDFEITFLIFFRDFRSAVILFWAESLPFSAADSALFCGREASWSWAFKLDFFAEGFLEFCFGRMSEMWFFLIPWVYGQNKSKLATCSYHQLEQTGYSREYKNTFFEAEAYFEELLSWRGTSPAGSPPELTRIDGVL